MSNSVVVETCNAVMKSRAMKSLFIVGTIGGIQSQSMMVDTGSAITIISNNLFKSCKTKLMAADKDFSVANGGTLSMLGKTKLCLEIGGIQFTHEVYVAKEIIHEAILGNDFLSKNLVDIL